MMNEKRNYPKVRLDGEVSILLAGIVRSATLVNVSPSGILVECRHQLIEQLSKCKSASGLYPDFELEFNLPYARPGSKSLRVISNVSCCRRLRQDSYHLGLNFVSITEKAEQRVASYIDHSIAA